MLQKRYLRRSHAAAHSDRISNLLVALSFVAMPSLGLSQGLVPEVKPYAADPGAVVYVTPSQHPELGSEAQALAEIASAIDVVGIQSLPASVDVQLKNERPTTNGDTAAFVEVIDIDRPGAAAMQLRLRQVELGGATLTVSSPSTGVSQPFDTQDLLEGNGQTLVFFDADMLRVQLAVPRSVTVPPLSEIIGDVVTYATTKPAPWPDEMNSEVPEQQASTPDGTEEQQCGADTRELSQRDHVGRMFPAACTAFLLDDDILITAGHCFRRREAGLQIVEFNVGLSDPDTGALAQQDARHVYPVRPETMACGDCSVATNHHHGRDWAVFKVGRNSVTGLSPSDAQGVALQIPPSLELDGEQVRVAGVPVSDLEVIGFGEDSDPMRANRAQQAASGSFSKVAVDGSTSMRLDHFVDTMPGNSGSPILASDPSAGESRLVVGIHTGGKCSPLADRANSGTAATLPAFRQALSALRGS